MNRLAIIFLLLFSTLAHASGPVAPKGWIATSERFLPNGQECCFPADLNGTGLVGGGFVFISSDGKEFGVFALTYTPSLGERWHLLEKHPISQLAPYRIAIEPSGRFPNASVKICRAESDCVYYHMVPSKGTFERSDGQ